MKKLLYFVLLLIVLSFACSLPSTATPGVTAPPVTEVAVTPNVICNELSLFLDPALATAFDCQTIPESTMEFGSIRSTPS